MLCSRLPRIFNPLDRSPVLRVFPTSDRLLEAAVYDALANLSSSLNILSSQMRGAVGRTSSGDGKGHVKGVSMGRSGSSVVGPAVSRYRPGETGGVGQVIAGERKPIEEWRPFEVVQFLERLLREDAEETKSARRKAINKSAMTGVFLRVGHPLQHVQGLPSELANKLILTVA